MTAPDALQPLKARVVHLTASCWPDSGGIARHVYDLTRDGPCTIVAPAHANRSTVLRHGGVMQIRVARQAVLHSAPTGALTATLVPHLSRLARHADLIHVHLPFPMALGASMLVPRLVPWIVTYHNAIQADVALPSAILAMHQRLENRLLARASAIIVATHDYAATIPVLDRFRHKVAVIPYGIELPCHHLSKQPDQHRETNLLLFVGRLAYYKGVHILLRALAQVPDARLAIVGDGPEKSALHALACRLNVGERVTWHGWRNDEAVRVLYRSATALVLPSTGASESFGLVQVEAHAHGLPVISSDLPGLRAVNVDGETGLLARAGDAGDLARAVRAMLADPQSRLRFGAKAALRARECYGRERMVVQTQALYARVLAASSSRRSPRARP